MNQNLDLTLEQLIDRELGDHQGTTTSGSYNGVVELTETDYAFSDFNRSAQETKDYRDTYVKLVTVLKLMNSRGPAFVRPKDVRRVYVRSHFSSKMLVKDSCLLCL